MKKEEAQSDDSISLGYIEYEKNDEFRRSKENFGKKQNIFILR